MRRELPVVPDLGMGFDVPEVESRRDGSSVTVGISTIPYVHPAYWRATGMAQYRAFIDALTDFSEVVIGSGHRLVIYGTTEWVDTHPVSVGRPDEIERFSRTRPAPGQRRRPPCTTTVADGPQPHRRRASGSRSPGGDTATSVTG